MKKILFALAACLPFAFLTSCDPVEQQGEGDPGVPTECTYYLESNVTETIVLADKRFKDVKLNVKAVETVGVEANLTFTLKADPSLVAAYNTANSTDCVELPAGCYEFDKSEVVISRFGTNSTTATLKITANSLEQGKTYLLPVTIGNVTGGAYKLTEAPQIYVLVQAAEVQGGEDEGETDITAGLYDDPCVPADASKTPDLVIKTAEDMKTLRTLLEEDKVKYVVLDADIDMSTITDWTPLNSESPFTKGIEFNGQGHTIKNFSCSAGAYRSMFGILYGRVYDVKFEGANVDGAADGGTQPCAIVAGYAGNKSGNTYAVIHDVEVTGTLTGKGGGVGGIVGVAVNLVMKRCSFDGDINNGNRRVGGLVGYHNAQMEDAYLRIEDCWSAGTIKGTQQTGGILGQTQYDNGKNGFNTKASIVKHCYSTMAITSDVNAGGIVGGCSYGGTYSTMELTINKDMIIGNIAWNDKIDVPSTTTGKYSSGAVVGYCNIYQYFIDCYRKADLVFSCPLSDSNPITLMDQDNTSPELSLFAGTNVDASCPYAYQHAYPYHGKAAPASATVSSLAKQLKWDETVWDLSSDLPVLK